jgi:hypothetical protein
MKCLRCGFESDGYTLNNNCSLCGFFGIPGDFSAANATEIAPWETESADESPLRALAVTFRNSFYSSKRFFSKIACNPTLIPALIYGMVVGSIGTCATALWSGFPSLSFSTLFSNSGIMGGFSDAVSPGNLIATPLILLAQLFFCTVYVHSMLFITKSRKKPFLFTFKTMCYAEGSMVFQLLPLIGPMVGIFAWIYLTVSGIRSVHGISGKRALLVLLLPALFLTIVAIAIIGAMAVLAAGFFSGTPIDPFSLFKQR